MTKKVKKSLLVFARVPEIGRVKTRLSAALDHEMACRLYKLFVEDLLAGLPAKSFDATICYDPPDGGADMAAWLGPSFRYRPQHGTSLGEKMRHAFAEAVAEGAGQVVLIGSDIPDLDGCIIEAAFAGLQTHDGVIGPAVDGGYYLLGFTANAFYPAVFRDMPWGTPHVFEDTMNAMKNENLAVRVLPLRQDVDTIEDLKDLVERARRRPELDRLKTIRYLAEHPDLLN